MCLCSWSLSIDRYKVQATAQETVQELSLIIEGKYPHKEDIEKWNQWQLRYS